MSKQVGNQNRIMFVMTGYFWLIHQTLSYSLYVLVCHIIFMARLFCAALPAVPGGKCPLCPS